jgi:hypothetical protein
MPEINNRRENVWMWWGHSIQEKQLKTPWLESASELYRPPLWSSGQSSWLQIQRSGFDSWRYQIFWEVVGLERSPLTLVSTIEELLDRKNSGFGLENRWYGRRDPSSWSRGNLYPQKLALTSLTSDGRSVGTRKQLAPKCNYDTNHWKTFI